MQLTEEQFIEDWQKRMGRNIPLTVGTAIRYINLRAQADARPFGWLYADKTGEHFSKRGPTSYSPEDLSEYEVKVTPLYTHPEASAQPMCVKCGDGIMAHDPGTCGNCHAIGAEASAPGLGDEVRKLIQHAAEFIGGAVNYGQNAPDEPPGPVSQWDYDAHYLAQGLQALLTRASAATVAEPTVVRGVRVCSISDIECTKQCGAICHHEATQQQAEPSEIDPIKFTEELYRAYVLKILDDVEGIAGERTDAHWSGFQNAVEEIRHRVSEPTDEHARAEALVEIVRANPPLEDAQQQAEPGADERDAKPLQDLLYAYENALQEEDEEAIAPARQALIAYLKPIIAAQSGQRAGVAEKPWDAAVHDVVAERTRQITHEGATPIQDDGYTEGELALAASCYAMASSGYAKGQTPPIWPWHVRWWKPSYGRRDLVKAGALILAEIERLDRAAAPTQQQEGE